MTVSTNEQPAEDERRNKASFRNLEEGHSQKAVFRTRRKESERERERGLTS